MKANGPYVEHTICYLPEMCNSCSHPMKPAQSLRPVMAEGHCSKLMNRHQQQSIRTSNSVSKHKLGPLVGFYAADGPHLARGTQQHASRASQIQSSRPRGPSALMPTHVPCLSKRCAEYGRKQPCSPQMRQWLSWAGQSSHHTHP